MLIIAGVTDWLDGFLARRLQSESIVGKTLDPLADKFLVTAIYLAAYQKCLLPWWFCSVIWGRDALIIIGSGFLWAFNKIAKKVFVINPSIISKINTFLQIVLILMLLIIPHHTWWINILVVLTACTTLFSLLEYIKIFYHYCQAMRYN